MSDRPQTTRNKIMCIMNTDNAQIMFLDTPGIHKPQHKLGQYMVRAAESTLHEVDVVLFVVDVSEKRGAGELSVEIDEIKIRDNDDIYIRANIFVERESQKGIVIGAKGSLLKKVGEQARKDIESLLGNKVFLDLWVKVKPDWRNKDKALKQFGYEG